MSDNKTNEEPIGYLVDGKYFDKVTIQGKTLNEWNNVVPLYTSQQTSEIEFVKSKNTDGEDFISWKTHEGIYNIIIHFESVSISYIPFDSNKKSQLIHHESDFNNGSEPTIKSDNSKVIAELELANKTIREKHELANKFIEELEAEVKRLRQIIKNMNP